MENNFFISGDNALFLDHLYQQYQQNPYSLEPSWKSFFDTFNNVPSYRGVGASQRESDVSQRESDVSQRERDVSQKERNISRIRAKEGAVMKLINAYRERGHLKAKIDPISERPNYNVDLDLKYFRLEESDVEREFEVGRQIGLGKTKLRHIIARLKKTYCSSIGIEYRHIPNSKVRTWIHQQIEPNANQPDFLLEEKIRIYKNLAKAVLLEEFFSYKSKHKKRFSLEGTEALIPGIHEIFEYGSSLGVKEFVIGTAHRGRLNVLVNLFGKSYENMFSEFLGNFHAMPVENGGEERVNRNYGDGDVAYHLGHSATIKTKNGKGNIHLTLRSNPSHLEAVNPVVLGSVWGKAQKKYMDNFEEIVPILIHGDAAIAGQGVVYEIMNFCKLDGYSTGGTVHIVINNQVGFTATETETRSSLYCTDIAKMTGSPVFHVNADDVEAVVHVTRLAIQLRQEFGIDTFVDLVGYRLHGHNEGDDPKYTQPILYRKIEEHHSRFSVLDIYEKKLIEEGTLSQEECERVRQNLVSKMEQKWDKVNVKNEQPSNDNTSLGGLWKGIRAAQQCDFEQSPETGVPKKDIEKIALALTTIPDSFCPYRKLKRILSRHGETFSQGRVNWSLAELIAYGSLLIERIPVRLSGQDSRRGTFSHRHAVWFDEQTEKPHIPLNSIAEGLQENFYVYNSHLSEYGVLGFEYGCSLVHPKILVVWEAQFGDFVNGAQIILDQFISSSESKWQRMSGIVLLLPHGYDGQGPEHSCARLGRFLDLCAENNMIIASPTTAANFFHLLRRQVMVEYRKPLIVMTPKSMLRSSNVESPVSELVHGRFKEIIDDQAVDTKKVKRLLLCTGKIYYELCKERDTRNDDSIAIVRLEQLYPIPFKQDQDLRVKYQHVQDWIWVQEEPLNMGPWTFIQNRFKEYSDRLRVIARPESASPAPGDKEKDRESQRKVVEDSFAT